MEHLEFEPFGERLAQSDGSRRTPRASRWLLRAGSAVFWSLAAVIVLARAVYFDPRVFESLDHFAAIARSTAGF